MFYTFPSNHSIKKNRYIWQGIATFIVLFGLGTPLAEATSGCCSWHGGVNSCGSDGYYMCNDGSESPTCTCSQTTTIYDLESKIVLEGADACPLLPSLIQSNVTQLSSVSGQIETLNNQETSEINQIRNNEQEAIQSQSIQNALTGGAFSGAGNAALESTKNEYENEVQDTQTRFELMKNSVQLMQKQYMDFSDFLKKFQTDFCSTSTNSSSAYQSNAPRQSLSSSSLSTTNKDYCGKNSYYSPLLGCKCNSGYAMQGGSCQYSPSVKITDPAFCISKNPCKCTSGYKPVGNSSCVPMTIKPSVTKHSSSSSSSRSSTKVPSSVSCKSSGKTKTCQCPSGYKPNRTGNQCVRTR